MPSHLIARDRLVALLAAARDVRIAVIGDAMLDVYLTGDVARISPEAPVPVVRVTETRHALGGAANVAQNVVALGAQVELVAAVGDDHAGERLAAMLSTLGGDAARGLVRVERPTTTKTRVIARAQQLLRFDEEDDADVAGAEHAALAAAVGAAIADADALVLEDYNKGVLTQRLIADAIAAARHEGIPVVVDPKYRNFFSYRGATVFKPNRRELEAALGAAVDLEHPDAVVGSLARLGCDHLLLTLGDRGMVLQSADGAQMHVPAAARELYDVVGAGDTVTAYLAAMLAAGATAREAAVVANFAAGEQVGKLGAASVTAEEVLAAWEHFRG
jgi:D-beta-D-heptose 7-phosphate kinase/D-beta-D-heptose 1-phosphate adenosyltransferase